MAGWEFYLLIKNSGILFSKKILRTQKERMITPEILSIITYF